MVALLKAQELGLEVPSAVYNFSQGQMRLQNALTNVNNQIDETEKAAKFFAGISVESNPLDMMEDIKFKDRQVFEGNEDYHLYMTRLEKTYSHEVSPLPWIRIPLRIC